MGTLRYIFTTAWKRASTLWQCFWVVAFVAPLAMSTQAGRLDMPVLGDIANFLPWWGWIFLAILIAQTFLIGQVGGRAKELEDARKPKVAVDGLSYRDSAGRLGILIKIRNASTTDLIGIKARLRAVEGGKMYFGPDDYREIEPIQIFTTERRREFLNDGDQYVRPFDLANSEPKTLEALELRNGAYWEAHLFDAGKDREICLDDGAQLNFDIHGQGVWPVHFSLKYDEVGEMKSGFFVKLIVDDEIIDCLGYNWDTDMSRGKFLSLEEAQKQGLLDQFAKEHPNETDAERFERLLKAMASGKTPEDLEDKENGK